MSPRREAVLEILSAITGLSGEEVEAKKPLHQLLDDVNVDKPGKKVRRYRFGVFTFLYPRVAKDGGILPFLSISFDWKKLEDWELNFPTYEPTSDTADIEFSLAGDLPKRFLKKVARAREKAAAKAAAKTSKVAVGKPLRRRASLALAASVSA